MMKRILALVLIVASMALVLTGCAYRYDKKNMSKYAKADYEKLDALLAALEIEDGDFGRYIAGDYARDAKVLEKIDSILIEKIKAEDENKLKGDTDTYGYRQKIYFAYYCSIEIDGVKHYFNTQKMNDEKLTSLISNPKYANAQNPAPTEELLLDDAYLSEIFKGINGKLVKDYKYDSESSSSTAIAAGDLVFATYKYSYTKGQDTVTVTTEYMPIAIPAAGEAVDSLGALLVGKSLGKIDIDTASPLKFKDAEGNECTLSSLTVNLRVKAGEAVEVKHITYTKDEKVTDASNTATDKKLNLNNEVITYYVYPAYAYEAAAFNAESIVEVIFGESISTSSLPCFADDEDLKKVVEKVVNLKTTYDQLNSKATASGATDKQKQDAKDAKKELDTAVGKLYEDLKAKDSAVETLILKEYKESVYEELESKYDADIRTKLAAKIWKWAEENIEIDTENLPKSAVKEAKAQILAVHKNTYYTGTDSNNKPYTDSHKTFAEYLANGVADYKGKDVDTEMDKQAREDVAEIVRIYAIAQHYSDKVERVTNADVSLYLDELYPQLYYTFYLSGNYNPTVEDVRDLYGDTALRASLTFDRIMDYFLATEEKDGHISYKNVTIQYK